MEQRKSVFFKSKAFIILVSIAVLLSAAIPIGYKYYSDYLNVPNFVSSDSNYVIVSAQEARPGDKLTYIISLTNEGRRKVDDVVVTTDFPENVELVSDNIDYIDSVGAKSLTFLIDSMEIGQQKKLSFDVKVDSPLDNGTIIANNRMDISYRRSDTPEPIMASFETRLQTKVISSVDFSESNYQITHQNGEHIRMGDRLDVDLLIKNSGDMAAAGISITGIIDQNTQLIEGSFKSDWAYMDMNKDEAAIRIDRLNPQDQAVISYSVKVGSGLIDNTKLVFEPTIENSSNQLLLESKEFVVRAFPEFTDFALTGIDENGGDLLSNDIVKYTVTFKNIGDGSAFDVFVENKIPDNASFVEASVDPSMFNWEMPDRVFSIKIDQLAPGEEFSFFYRARVASGLYFGAKVTNTSTLVYQDERLDSQSVTHTVISNYSYNVVIMGDSQVAKTQWTSHLNNIFVQSYPYGSFNFIKSGRGGETVDLGYNRMISSGIMGQNPYIFILNYGTNDSDLSSGYYRIAPDTFRYYLGAMIDTIKTNTGAMVVVMSTGPVSGRKVSGQTNEGLAAFNSIAAQVCAQRGAVFVDVFNPMLGSGNADQYLTDGLHYNSAGDQLVARIAFNAISSRLNRYGTR